MELLFKLTDIKDKDEKGEALPVSKIIDEAMTTVNESLKKIDTLAAKGRKKIDLVGELSTIELTIK